MLNNPPFQLVLLALIRTQMAAEPHSMDSQRNCVSQPNCDCDPLPDLRVGSDKNRAELLDRRAARGLSDAECISPAQFLSKRLLTDLGFFHIAQNLNYLNT